MIAPKNNIRPLRMKCWLDYCENEATRLIVKRSPYMTGPWLDLPACDKHVNQLGLKGRPLPDVAMTREELE